MKFNCAQCGKVTDRPAGHVNRSRARGDNLYCGRRCSGLGRRQGKTKAQLVEEKRLYDIEYRTKNRAMLKAKKRAYYQATRDPEKEREKRKARMPYHVEYCRQPEYKRYKQAYDRRYRSKKLFGPFADAAMLVVDLNREIKQRTTDHEIRQQNGTLNKVQDRRREAKAPERGRPRQRFQRRDRHSPPVGV